MYEDGEPTAGSSNARKAQEADTAGIDPYLGADVAGASAEEAFVEAAFARALGRAVERYLDSLEGRERVRVLLGLHRPGVLIPEERMLPEDSQARKKTLQAAAELHACGKLRRVRSRQDGRIFWVKAPRAGDQATR